MVEVEGIMFHNGKATIDKDDFTEDLAKKLIKRLGPLYFTHVMLPDPEWLIEQENRVYEVKFIVEQ